MNTIINSSTTMTGIANSSTTMNIIINSYPNIMNKIINSSIAMDVVINSFTAMTEIANSPTVMNTIWSTDSLRQSMWSSANARLALYNNPTQLKALTINSTPNLISETILNKDKNAGYLTYQGLNGRNGNWNAVNINDGNKYLVWIHFHSYGNWDWYHGKIASYDRTTDLQVTNGGFSLTRGNFNTTSNGLWVYFIDQYGYGNNNNSYARVWYIKV